MILQYLTIIVHFDVYSMKETKDTEKNANLISKSKRV